jgi:hypothetical protein
LVKFLQNCKAETGAYPLDFADLPRLNLSDRLLQELREGAAAYDTSAAQRPTYDPWASLVDRAVTIAREALKSAFAAAQQNDAAAWRTAIVRGWSRFQDGLASCVLATGDLPRVPTDLLTSLTTVLGSRKEAKRLVRRIYRQLETVAKSTSQHEENVGGRGQSVSLLFGAHYHTIRRGSQWAGDGAGDS